MQKILLISDTHSYLEPKLLKYIQQADEVWHAGDIGNIEVCESIQSIKKLKAVYGNIDDSTIRKIYPENLEFNCEDVKVLMTHIGGYPGKYPSKIKKMILDYQPQLFICGHSHILKVMYDQSHQLLHINPGASGIHGFHQVKTAVRFEIDKKEIKNLEVIELGKRNEINEL